MKQYEEAKVEIIFMNSEDVISTSLYVEWDGDKWNGGNSNNIFG